MKNSYAIYQIESYKAGYTWMYLDTSKLLATVCIRKNANLVKALYRHLHKIGIVCNGGLVKATEPYDNYVEIQTRSTEKPLYALIPYGHHPSVL